MIFDAHCDTISLALDNDKSINDKVLEFNLQDVILPHIQVLAAFINPRYKNGFKRANKILDKFYDEYDKNKQKIYLIKNKDDIKEDNNKLGVILSIENGKAIDKNLDNINKLYSRGIRIMSITYNDDSILGSGALTKNDKGLTKFGKEYIQALIKQNIIIDVSHASARTFYDTIDLTNKPIVATHSCVKSLCNHPRNLTDDQIKKIANTGGVIGICFCSDFLKTNNRATSDDVVRNIEYIVNLVGEDYVGLGSDFDGVQEEHKLLDIHGIKDINIILSKLKKLGLNDTQINKISSDNFLRVVKNIL